MEEEHLGRATGESKEYSFVAELLPNTPCPRFQIQHRKVGRKEKVKEVISLRSISGKCASHRNLLPWHSLGFN